MKIHCTYNELFPISSLKPSPKNRNKHPQEQIERLAKILEYQGWRYPIKVSNQSGFITSGHGRLLAAKSLGQTEVPVNFQDYESEEQEYADIQADNAIASWAELDLAGINTDLEQLGPDFDLDMLGIKDFVLEPADKYGDQDADSIPGVQSAVVSPGELYHLGNHRLLCGDSTYAASVSKLMNGEKADMVFTDPPYGISYQKDMSQLEATARNRRKDGKIVSNDELTGEKLLIFLFNSIQAWPLKPGGVFYVCSPSGCTELYFRKALGELLRECIVWNKDQFVFGRQDYHWKHESILYGWAEGAGHYFVDDRTQNTVWDCPRPKKSEEHPTMKPVELVERAIRNSSRSGENLFDGFAGAGTAFIACEKTNRKCYGMEIDPIYCGVILDRWAKFTGKDPVREDGKPWSEVKLGHS